MHGAQKWWEKLAKDLHSAASEPKQKKLCFAPLSDRSESPDKSDSELPQQEIEENETVLSGRKSGTPWPSTPAEKLLTTPPYQPIDGIPFQRDIYFQNVKDDQRRWLTYDSVENKLHCRICAGCFSENRSGDLVCRLGGDNFRRASQTVKRHESSQHHRDASDVYFRHLQGRHRLTSPAMVANRKEVLPVP